MAHRIVESSASNGAKYCEKCGATENFIRRCPNDADLIIERKRLELEMLRHSASGGDNSFLGHTSISMFSFTGAIVTLLILFAYFMTRVGDKSKLSDGF